MGLRPLSGGLRNLECDLAEMVLLDGAMRLCRAIEWIFRIDMHMEWSRLDESIEALEPGARHLAIKALHLNARCRLGLGFDAVGVDGTRSRTKAAKHGAKAFAARRDERCIQAIGREIFDRFANATAMAIYSRIGAQPAHQIDAIAS